MESIDNNKIIELLKKATDIFICNNKLIIDINLNRIIINNVLNGKYYINLFNNRMIEKPEINECFYSYSETNLKLILKYYPDLNKRKWLANHLNVSRAQLNDRYRAMIACYLKSNRYSKQYWQEELEELKINKNNLEYHAKKYNRSLKSLKDTINQYNL